MKTKILVVVLLAMLAGGCMETGYNPVTGEITHKSLFKKANDIKVELPNGVTVEVGSTGVAGLESLVQLIETVYKAGFAAGAVAGVPAP